MMRLPLSLLLSASLLSSALLAKESFESTLGNLMKNKANLEIEVIKKSELPGLEGLRFVIVETKQNGQWIPIFTSQSGDAVIPFTNLLTGNEAMQKSLAGTMQEIQKHNENAQKGQVAALFEKLPKEAFVTLDGPSKKSMIVVTDPECPYCRKELEEVEKHLKEADLKLVFAPVHGRSAFIKSQLIYEEVKKAKNNEEKIQIMRKYFDQGYTLTPEQEKLSPALVEENTKTLFNSGLIRGVPFRHMVE